MDDVIGQFLLVMILVGVVYIHYLQAKKWEPLERLVLSNLETTLKLRKEVSAIKDVVKENVDKINILVNKINELNTEFSDFFKEKGDLK